jgi:hypothetical protein
MRPLSDELDAVLLMLPPILVSAKMRTKLQSYACVECDMPIRARTADALLEASADHQEWKASPQRLA